MKRSYSRLLVLIMALVMSMSMASSVFADDGDAPADGKYMLYNIDASLSMIRNYLIKPAMLEVDGEDAVLTFSGEGNVSKRYDEVYVGDYEDITDENKDTIGTKGTLNGDVITFKVPFKSSKISETDPLHIVLRYNDTYVDSKGVSHKDEWYKASSGNAYSLTLGALTPVESTELAITNITSMFNAVSASLETAGEDKTLVMALNGTGYRELFKGTYDEAVANGDNTENWIHGYQNAAGKWEFRIPVGENESFIPLVAISNSYYTKYLNGENPLERAFYARQITVDAEEKTLVTGDYSETFDITITNNVSMFRPGTTATVTLKGGPNNNEYSYKMTLPMTTASMSNVRAATYTNRGGELVEDREVVIPFDTEKKVFADIPVLDGKLNVIEFQSASNGKWYKRDFTLNLAAGTGLFDPHKAGSKFFDMTEEQALAYVKAHASVDLLNELIEAIQVQYRDENTDKLCKAAKACWDELDDDDKEEDDGYFSEDTGDASKDDPLNTAPDKKDELLVVSFGTSFNDSRVETIGAVEKALADRFGNNWAVRRAFTAQIIINHVQSRDGEKIDNVEQAMEKAVAAGVRRLVVQPTHLMSGAEYDELKEAIDKYADKMTISYAKPLLDSDKDKEIVAKAVVAAAAEEAGFADVDAAIADEETAFVFMGHGTEHVANATYTYMQETMDKLGYKNCFIGTVEGLPESTAVDAVLEKVQEAGYTKVVLRPLMVVAGDHANNDMAGDDEDSWKSIFSDALGAENVSTQIKGLGEIEAVQQLYIAHTYPVVEPIIEINNKILELVKNQDLIAAYWKVSEFIDEYKDLVDLIVEQLEATGAGITPEALKEYTDQLDEYIKAMNRYVKEFEDMPEVQDAIERAIKAAEDLKALLEEHGYEIDSLDDILPAIEKAQAELQNALEDLIATIDEEMIQEALEALKEKAAEWAADAGYNEEDIQKMLDQIAELQAIIEEYAKLTPSEAVDKLIEEATALIADNLDAITDLANEAIDKAVEQWNEGAFDEYLEQLGTSREAIEDLIEDLTAYAIGYFIFDESYIGLQEQLMDALDQIANMEADLQLYKELWESAEKELKEANAEKAQKDKITKKFINGYKVMKAKPKMIKVKALKKRKAKVTFRGLKKLQATKYQINYKTGKKAKNKTVKKATKTNKKINATLTKLKKGKKYTVKVRATYQFKYAGKTYKFNSKWSKAKKIKAKK